MKNKKKGFTLVELIVVIAIVAILAAVAVPTTFALVNRAKDQKISEEAGGVATIFEHNLTSQLGGLGTITADDINEALKGAFDEAKISGYAVDGNGKLTGLTSNTALKHVTLALKIEFTTDTAGEITVKVTPKDNKGTKDLAAITKVVKLYGSYDTGADATFVTLTVAKG